MHKNQRVVVMDISRARGKTGTLVGTRRGILGLRKMRFAYIVKLDSGEVIYTGAIQKLKADLPTAV